MSLEEGQQASSIVKKRSFTTAFGNSQAILETLLPKLSTFVQSASNFWQQYSAGVARFVNDRLESWQDEAAPRESAPIKTKQRRRKHREHETDEQRAVRRASRKSSRQTNTHELHGTGDLDSPTARLKKHHNSYNAHTEQAQSPSANPLSQYHQAQAFNQSPPVVRHPRKSLRQHYVELAEARSRSSYESSALGSADASPMYRGLFAATLEAKRSALGTRTPRDAANVLNRMTPFKHRIGKPGGTTSKLPFTSSNLSHYLESPSQSSPDILYRSPGAPLPSPVSAFNPFKTKDKNNLIKTRTEEQSLEDLIAELRREHPQQYEWQKIDKEREARDIEIAKRRGLYQPVRLSIPMDTAKKVEKALHGQLPYDNVLVDKFNQEIKVKDLQTLKSTAWLNDEVINFYMNLIAERAKESKVRMHAFNTFFYTKLAKSGYKDVRRWAKKAKVDISKCDLVLVPVHLGVHWCMSVINLKQKRFEYWDSLQGGAGQAFTALREYMANEAPGIDTSTWTDYVPPSGPRQRNGYDCGVFACQTAEAVSRAQEPLFSQDEMPELRKRMAASILDAKIY